MGAIAGEVSMNENDIVEVVDEIVDDVDPSRIEREAERLGISKDELMSRILNELRARLDLA
jgi:hypothetical protein